MNKITDFVVKDINLVDVDLSIYDGKNSSDSECC